LASEVQAEARRWPVLLPPLLKAGLKVVTTISASLTLDDSGFRHLRSTGHTGRVWVKLSDAYRNGDGPVGDRIAKAAIPLLRDNFNVDHFVWGRDWPHTQCVRAWIPGFPIREERRTVLVLAPVSLFKF
jgi:predicted TIM-barrel fold metal-dependent hydrolase